MPDSVVLQIGKQQISNFISYSISSDLYKPADAFRLELSSPSTKVETGLLCELYINGSRELTGITEKITKKVAKEGETLIVEGRDLMGLVVDSYCESFVTIQGMKLKALAERLLATVPFINTKQIDYQKNLAGKLKTNKKKTSAVSILDAAQNISQVEPGMTVFHVLKEYSLSRGLLFYSLPDGTLVFGRPKIGGEAIFKIQIAKNGKGNNAIEGEKIEDISRRYSKVTVIGQQQGTESTKSASGINTKYVARDSEFPFYKPYVTRNNNDSITPPLYARMLLEKMRRAGSQLNYRVARHSQDGRNWTINELCQVKDEALNVEGAYLVYGRTFELTKQGGPITKVRLGPPGLVA